MGTILQSCINNCPLLLLAGVCLTFANSLYSWRASSLEDMYYSHIKIKPSGIVFTLFVPPQTLGCIALPLYQDGVH